MATNLLISVDTLDNHPRIQIFGANGASVPFALDYFSGHGDDAKGGKDTYFTNIAPGAYWVIVHGDMEDHRLSKVTAIEGQDSIGELVAIVDGATMRDDDWLDLRATIRRLEVPKSVVDELIGRPIDVVVH